MPSAKKVLLIDDEPHIISNYIDELRKCGYEVTVHATADGGLQCLRNDCLDIDIVVLDIQMPTPKGIAKVDTNDGMDTGFWLLQETRELLEEQTLPVIILSNRKAVALSGILAERFAFNPANLVRITTKNDTSSKLFPILVQQVLDEFEK